MENHLQHLSAELQEKVRNICREHGMSLEERLLRAEDGLKKVLTTWDAQPKL
jgi:hypothetical protein